MLMTAMPPISLVVLVYNEAATIENELNLFNDSIINKLPGSEIIVAEDGSTDGTTEIILRLKQELGVIHSTSRQRKGYTKALIDAVRLTRNDLIFFSDTGLKHDPGDFWKLYEYRDKYDLISGRKVNRRDQLYRRLLTHAYNFFLRHFFKMPGIHDADSGFKLFNDKIKDQVFRQELVFKGLVNSEIVLRAKAAGLAYTEVPVSYTQREGVSRGIPPHKIPRIVLTALGQLYSLKKELAIRR